MLGLREGRTFRPILTAAALTVLLALGSPAVSGAAGKPAASARLAEPERHTVSVEGHPIRVWARRPAKPRGAVLFVHGRTWSSRANFDLQTPAHDLSVMKDFADRGLSAYAIDQRGYGETPRDASGVLTPKRAAADLEAVLAWIAKREGRKPVLVGYSRGSLVAFLTAQIYPESAQMLVLYGYPRPSASATARGPMRVANTLAAAGSDFITPGAASAETIKAYAEQALAADPVKADWASEEDFAALADPAALKLPTLMLIGAGDPRLADQAPVFARLGTPARSMVVLPGSDHAAHVERTHGAWVAAIIDFIELNEQTRTARP